MRKRRQRRIAPFIVAILFIVVVVLIAILTNIIEKYTPTKERADLGQVFELGENETALIVNNYLSESKGIIIDDVVYLDYDFVSDNLNSRFYWDGQQNVLIYTTPTEVIKAEVGNKYYMENKNKVEESYVIVKTQGDKAYVALDYVKKYTDMEYEIFAEPNRIVLNSTWDRQVADIRKNDVIRYRGGIKSPIITDVTKNDTVTIVEKGDEWCCVLTKDGFIGYIKNSMLINERSEELEHSFEEPVYTSISKDYKINMVWHMVTAKEANNNILDILADTKGVTTVCPTWFSLADLQGNINSFADSTYVDRVHQMGMEVWGLIGNTQDASVSVHDVLSNTASRENLVNQLISTAIQYNLDGINVDFEGLAGETGEHFIQFIRELSIKCRSNQIVLSIDNYVPEAYTDHYDRKEQGIVADYVIIMGYDEHYNGSEEAGSVASYDFVKRGIENTLAEVPKEKIINGVPFYTRIWTETPKTEEQIAAEADNQTEYIPYILGSQTYGMAGAEKFLEDNGIEAVWDDTTKQYYAEAVLDGITYKVWLEEEASIEEKMKLISEYDLAGVAAWRIGLEKSTIWDVILKYIN